MTHYNGGRMMKLYISYYGNYVSIVEGKYNYKKDKYVIKNLQFIKRSFKINTI